METMTEKFNKMKTAVQRSDSKIKELRKERDQATSQVNQNLPALSKQTCPLWTFHKKMASRCEERPMRSHIWRVFDEQVRGLTEKIRRTEEDDVVMATVNTYVEEWKVTILENIWIFLSLFPSECCF